MALFATAKSSEAHANLIFSAQMSTLMQSLQDSHQLIAKTGRLAAHDSGFFATRALTPKPAAPRSEKNGLSFFQAPKPQPTNVIPFPASPQTPIPITTVK